MLQMNQLALEAAEKIFCRSVIIGTSLTAHALPNVPGRRGESQEPGIEAAVGPILDSLARKLRRAGRTAEYMVPKQNSPRIHEMQFAAELSKDVSFVTLILTNGVFSNMKTVPVKGRYIGSAYRGGQVKQVVLMVPRSLGKAIAFLMMPKL